MPGSADATSSAPDRRSSDRAALAAVVLLSTLLTIWWSWPAIRRWDTTVAYATVGGTMGTMQSADFYLNAWAVTWVSHALATDPTALYDGNAFHPARFSVAYSESMIGYVPLFAPVYWATGNPILALNVMAALTYPLAAADILARDFGIPADIYSAPSFSELRREALEIERWNRLHPGEPAKKPYVAQALSKAAGPFIAATDYMRAWPDMIRQWVPGRFVTLGTDGFGRSDGRAALRKHFEVDAKNIVYASLQALSEEGAIDKGTLKAALNKLGLDPNKLDPQKA